MIEHTGPISGVATDNKNLVATVGYDNRLILWDFESHEAIARGWHDHLVNSVSFSPCGSYVLSSSSDCTARIWNSENLNLIAVLSEHTDDVSQAEYSPSGDYIATSSYDKIIRIYNSKTYYLLFELLGHTGLIESFTWFNGSKNIISSGTDGKIILWDIEKKKISRLLSEEGFDIDTIAVTSSGKLVVGDDTGTITLYCENLSLMSKALLHSAGIKDIFCSPDSENICSLGYDGQAHLLVASDGKLTSKVNFDLPSYVWPRSGSFLSPEKLVLATFGSTFLSLDLKSEKWMSFGYTPSRSLNHVVRSKAGYVAIGDSGIAKAIRPKIGGPGTLCNFILEFDGKLFAGGQEGVIYELDSQVELFKHTAPLNCAGTFEVGEEKYLVVGSYSGDLLLFVASTDSKVKHTKTLRINSNAIKTIAISGSDIYTGSSDGRIFKVESRNSFTVSNPWPPQHTSILNDICVTEKGEVLSVSRDLTIVHHSETLCTKTLSRLKNALKCICYSEKDQIAIVGNYLGWIDFYDIASREMTNRPLRVADTGISSIFWDNVEECAIMSSYDGNVYRVKLNRKIIKVNLL
jgi:toxoflavin biosynthesis protein ToxC